MPYCSIDDIKNVIPERELINLTVDPPIPQDAVVDTARLNSVISFGDELINGYLRSRYNLPLESVPELIRNISVDVAVYRLYIRRPQKINETIENSYKNAVKLLEQIQKGLISLGVKAPDNDTETKIKSSFYVSNKTSKSRMFSQDVLNRF